MHSALYYLRVVYSVVILVIAALYGVVASMLCTILNKSEYSQYVCARFYYSVMKYFFGIDVKVINEHYLRNLPFIAVSNHQSTLDILMLGKCFPPGCTITAKKSLSYIPVFGWFMIASGTYFIERTNREKSVKTLNRGLQDVKDKKRGLWIFPEGTRSYTTDLTMLPFKKGAFHLAQQGGIPILPIVVSNTSTLMSPKWGVFNRGCITVKVLEPIPTENLKPEDVSEFAETVREKMIKELKENVGYSDYVNDTSIPPGIEDKKTN
ncbi:hypothetical protein Kpol_483p2 [Vanderwaltozyma polyspora DSM 70294]|uniref:1-acyl-sn-glycerol-3-phosphate acyltransferase n=1 Tax=Vanderwaltozyma polyspora (strain ATCC 22028 / DSM 70294 / BCRC 21397 / CBS 2163 / NBRC 10782 / NRRL Y-8283 / UCD 57-17) TaxID=436907 RepID=A7TQ54_VANPO|nr:uncharacterized protein Kpol_483p2 [Vanderwaltozyma polyspora DSM 70294]EDO15583.1 hypothetical protein Kpol_483p2 [Vanderwaltozyma polyspora DSM 70294]